MYLISFKEAQFARTFVDYMATKGIVIRVELDPDGNSQLFFENGDENSITLVKEELAIYIKNPYDKRYIDAAWREGEKSNFRVEKTLIQNALPKIVSVGPVTIIITVICVSLFVLLLLIGPREILIYLGYPTLNNQHQLWRYITPIFIHFSFLHIIFNSMWWWYLGGMVEKRKGWFKLLEIVFVAGILSNYAQAAISGPSFGGLSGVVYALMGYVWLYGEKIKSSGLGLDRSMIGIAVIWLLAGYIGVLGAIANTAHLIGLIIGLLLAAKDIWWFKR